MEPRHKKRVNHGSTAHRTYYFAKDILYLSHEPLLEKFREFKVFMKKLTRAIHKGEIHSADKLVENKPIYTLDHVIKERYCGTCIMLIYEFSLIISKDILVLWMH